MPRRRLTAKNVETLPAIAGRRTTYADTILPSLELRVSPDGRRSYSVRVWRGRGPGRRQVRHTLGQVGAIPLSRARDDARKILAHAGPAQPRRLTVGALLDLCMADITLRPSTRNRYERYARGELRPAFGDLLASDLQRGEVRVWHRALARRSPTTANRSLELLRRVYSWAVREELVEANPVQAVPRAEERRTWRVLSTDELEALVRVLQERGEEHPATDVVWLLLLTGVRLSEALGLRRREVQGQTLAISGERTKAGHDHLVPLSSPARAVVLRRMELAPGDCLFPAGGRRSGEDVPMRWHSAWKRELDAKLPGMSWTLHGLRHTLATQMREKLGIRRDVVSLILGHTLPGPEATRIYDRAELLEERRQALEAWASWLGSLPGSHSHPGETVDEPGLLSETSYIQRDSGHGETW